MALMRLGRRDPFEEFKLISDSLFDSIAKDFSNHQKGFPRYDQYNLENGSVVLEFPLAGYKVGELSVSAEGSQLVVSAEKSEQRTDAVRTVSGRSTQSFKKTFTADKNLDLENLEVVFEDGLLTIEIPSRQIEKPKAKFFEIKNSKLLKQ